MYYNKNRLQVNSQKFANQSTTFITNIIQVFIKGHEYDIKTSQYINYSAGNSVFKHLIYFPSFDISYSIGAKKMMGYTVKAFKSCDIKKFFPGPNASREATLCNG